MTMTIPQALRCWNCDASGITYVDTHPSGMTLYTDCAECGETQNAIL